MRILIALLVVLFAQSAWAEKVNIYRNSRPYLLNIDLPKGAEFREAGIDRKARYGAIDINLRLIQDHYRDCEALVNERVRNKAKDGYEQSKVANKSNKDCSLLLTNDGDGTMSSSFYVWQKRCECFAAMHFDYPSDERSSFIAISQGVVDSLRNNNHWRIAGQVAASDGKNDIDYLPMTCDEKRASGYVLDEDEVDYCGGLPRRGESGAGASDRTSGQDGGAAARAAAKRAQESAAARKAAEADKRSVKFKVINKDASTVAVAFYSQSRRVGWPAWTRHWVQSGLSTQTYNLSCQPGESICMGAWEKNNSSSYWGVGMENKNNCSGCCRACGSGLSTQTLLPGSGYSPPPVARSDDSGEVAGAIINGLTLGLGIGSAILGASPPAHVAPQAVPRRPAPRQSGISGTR